MESATLQLPTTGTYRIDPDRSSVRFSTRAMFGLLPVRGMVRISSGTLRVAAPPETSSVEVIIQADTFDSENQGRDSHVRSPDFLDTATYPEFTYSGGRWDMSPERPVLHGRLTVRGVTQPVDVALRSLSQVGGELTARATARVDRYAFGVVRSKGMAGRHLTLSIEVTAVS